LILASFSVAVALRQTGGEEQTAVFVS
jgi:hypothetical protein